MRTRIQLPSDAVLSVDCRPTPDGWEVTVSGDGVVAEVRIRSSGISEEGAMVVTRISQRRIEARPEERVGVTRRWIPGLLSMRVFRRRG